MFGMGLWELAAIGLIGLFIFGPERLPRVAAQAVRTLRDLRAMVARSRDELKDTIGPDLGELKTFGLDQLGIAELADLRTDPDARPRSAEPPVNGHAPSVSATPPPFDPDAT